MSDTRTHRGAHPEDAALFHASQVPSLRAAVADFSWLLERGYSPTSALELVGNRYELRTRQRMAVGRSACAASKCAARLARRMPSPDLKDRPLWIDGYNVLLSLKVALGGGVVFGGIDGTYRDLASVHGTYRLVVETLPSLRVLGRAYEELGSSAWVWWLDRPVSNSGRLKSEIMAFAASQGWNWSVELVDNPDTVLSQTAELIATADSAILDREVRWFNLAHHVIAPLSPPAWLIDFSADRPA